jgi:hypothetical protein
MIDDASTIEDMSKYIMSKYLKRGKSSTVLSGNKQGILKKMTKTKPPSKTVRTFRSVNANCSKMPVEKNKMRRVVPTGNNQDEMVQRRFI